MMSTISLYVFLNRCRSQGSGCLLCFLSCFVFHCTVWLERGLPTIARSRCPVGGCPYDADANGHGGNGWRWSRRLRCKRRFQIRAGNFPLLFMCNFHVLTHLLLIYICKLHWNVQSQLSVLRHGDGLVKAEKELLGCRYPGTAASDVEGLDFSRFEAMRNR